MITPDDLHDRNLPPEKRLAIALELAISTLNQVPSFRTHFRKASGRTLSSYDILPDLEAVLRECDPG